MVLCLGISKSSAILIGTVVAFPGALFKTVAFISPVSWLPANSSQLNCPLCTPTLCFLSGNSPYSLTGHCGGTKAGRLARVRRSVKGHPSCRYLWRGMERLVAGVMKKPEAGVNHLWCWSIANRA